MGSLAFTSSKYTQQKGFFATMPGVVHVPYPNAYRPLFAALWPCLLAFQGIDCTLKLVQGVFERTGIQVVAALIGESRDGSLRGLQCLQAGGQAFRGEFRDDVLVGATENIQRFQSAAARIPIVLLERLDQGRNCRNTNPT